MTVRTQHYRSANFRSELAALFGADEAQVAICLDALIGAGIIPVQPRNASKTVAISGDAAAVMAGLGGRQMKPDAVIWSASKLLDMQLQCELGSAARTVRQVQKSIKSGNHTFGSDMSKAFRDLWASRARKGLNEIPLFTLTVGWDDAANLYGMIRYRVSERERTLLYSSIPLRVSLPDPDSIVDYVAVNLAGGSLTTPLRTLQIGELFRDAG